MTTSYRDRLAAWQAYAQAIEARADRIRKMKEERAYQLAATVGLPRHALCIHNAALDDDMTGWCKGNPQRLRVAKRVNYMLGDWRAAALARAVISRHFPRS